MIFFLSIMRRFLKIKTELEGGGIQIAVNLLRVILCRGRTRYTPALPPRFCATEWWYWFDSWRRKGRFFWTLTVVASKT